mmetsp:Transcript_9967/g.20736  ORF Transcript_9967/g.20736 Transcript_9967/m.20736 type:complete len:85 (-) Transcript_9967:836-1090(-)
MVVLVLVMKVDMERKAEDKSSTRSDASIKKPLQLYSFAVFTMASSTNNSPEPTAKPPTVSLDPKRHANEAIRLHASYLQRPWPP